MAKRRRLNHNLVIEQAAALADAAGSASAVTLTDLAQALEIRPPSLYNHVAGLDELRQGMAVFALRELLAGVRAAALGLVGRAALMAIADTYRDFARAHPGIYPLSVRAPEPDEPELTALAQELLQFLVLLQATMGVLGDDAIHAVRGLRAILHGFVGLEAAGGFKMGQDVEESFRRLLAAFLDSLPDSTAGGQPS